MARVLAHVEESHPTKLALIATATQGAVSGLDVLARLTQSV